MSELRRRAYTGVRDLVRMQEAVSAAHDDTWWRTGDLAWGARNLSQLELGVWVTLWEPPRGGLPVAWVWPTSKCWVDHFVAPGAATLGLLAEMVRTAEATLLAAASAGDPVETATFMVGESEGLMRAALEAAGYAPIPEGFEVNRRSLETIAEPSLPPGYRLSGVDDQLVEGRVEAQRAAFAPSTLTLERYRRVRRLAPYSAELDRVVIDPGGQVVACCTAWLDSANASGLLEPVGTRPDRQRLGLGTAVCLDALHALRRAGARVAQVSCDAGSAGCATYRRAGFSVAERVEVMRRTLG